jgi:hypothetical protein
VALVHRRHNRSAQAQPKGRITDQYRPAARAMSTMVRVTTAAGAVVWVTARGSNALIGSISTGAFPREMALAPGRRTLQVSDYGSDQLQTIDLTTLP